MRMNTILLKLLGVNNAVIEDFWFENRRKEEIFVIKLRQSSRHSHRCPICGKKCSRYDTVSKGRRWRALDFGYLRVYIEADSHRVKCKKHGVIAERVSWARHKSRMTRDFENTVCWMTLHSSHTVVSQFMRVAWETVGEIAKRVYDEIRDKSPSRFDGLVNIGIDETSYKKGHKYMTVIVNHDTGALIWAEKGHGKTVLEKFFKELTLEQRESIQHVTADGARWIADCVAAFCPNAERLIDTFHVVQWATDALDNVRREIVREARDMVQNKTAKKRGRPKKGEEPAKKSKAQELKGSRYALLKNPDTLTPTQRATVDMIARESPKLHRSYLIKEQLRTIFQLPLDEARMALDAWIKWAQHCRIDEFVELQRKIRRHYDAILATISNGLSNARVEAINNKIKLTVRMGYGFRNIDNLIALVMLRCGKLNVELPGRA